VATLSVGDDAPISAAGRCPRDRSIVESRPPPDAARPGKEGNRHLGHRSLPTFEPVSLRERKFRRETAWRGQRLCGHLLAKPAGSGRQRQCYPACPPARPRKVKDHSDGAQKPAIPSMWHGLRQRRHGGIVRTRAVGDRGHVRGGMNASGVRGPKRSRRSRNGPWLPAGLGKIAISFHPHAEGAAVRRGDFAGILRLRK
jgi:hypothetical protein